MDAYALGRIDDDLTSSLPQLRATPHTVFAAAALDGPDHDVFLAYSLATGASSDGVGSGLGSVVVFDPCTSANCLGQLPPIPLVNPCHLPPWEHLLFCLIEAEHLRDALTEVVELLGTDGVAAVTDGRGRFLVELGADDRALVDQAFKVLTARDDIRPQAPHWSGEGRLIRG